MLVGQDLCAGSSFVFDPWVLYARGLFTAPNVVVAGIVGAGKSSLAKSLYVRSIAFGRRVYVPCDPKGEHTPVCRAIGGTVITLGPGLPHHLNPLDEGHRLAGLSDDEWYAQVTGRRRDLIGALAETILGRPLTPLEHTAIDIALHDAVHSTSAPVLPLVVDRLPTPSSRTDPRLPDDGRLVGHALPRLVDDEAWRLMAHPALLRRMDAHWRLARYFRIANLLVFHKLTDLDNVGDHGSANRALAASLLANAETRIIYRQETDQLGPTAEALGLNRTEAALLPQLGVGLLPQLGVGQGLWRIRDRSFLVQAMLHADEAEIYDTTVRMSI